MTITPSVAAALAAALLFGASTPIAKVLVGDVTPVLLAGLLYLGSGLGLWIVRIVRDRGFKSARLSPAEWPWFAAAIVSGGVMGPILLMYGLARMAAADASLLLNLEAVLTALLAWVVFRENADRRIVLGMALIVGGGVVLAWPTSRSGHSSLVGALAVAGACMCWAVDNNLTRKVSASDPVFIAGTKGLVAGLTSSALALIFGAKLPTAQLVAAAMGVGIAGYGLSLVLFVLALRGLGSARTGAYFSTAPFVGAAIAIVVFHEPVSWPLWLAATMMAAGVWLHLTEVHAHQHTHEPLSHTHAHRHDAHHQHQHAFAWDGHEPHTHPHTHKPLTHTHAHYPDLHHRHEH
jgi:drug/metabolite transporter (DMT)-like permease